MDQKSGNLVLHNKSYNTITGMNHTISVSNELLEELPIGTILALTHGLWVYIQGVICLLFLMDTSALNFSLSWLYNS